MQAQALVVSSSSMLFPQHDPRTHKRLFHNLVFGCAGKYFKTICALAPFSSTPTSSNTALVFLTMHHHQMATSHFS